MTRENVIALRVHRPDDTERERPDMAESGHSTESSDDCFAAIAADLGLAAPATAAAR